MTSGMQERPLLIKFLPRFPSGPILCERAFQVPTVLIGHRGAVPAACPAGRFGVSLVELLWAEAGQVLFCLGKFLT